MPGAQETLPSGGKAGAVCSQRPNATADGRRRWTNVRIMVEIEEFEPGVTNSQAVADYVRALFKVRALKRAVTDALIEAEERRQTLNGTQLREAFRLVYDTGAIHRTPGVVRRVNRQGASRDGV
jgi:hypothetical protein